MSGNPMGYGQGGFTPALQASSTGELPPIHVSPNQGKFLQLLARIQGTPTFLEIGKLGGYSTIWLGWALPAYGRLVTLENDLKHAEMARCHIANAGLARGRRFARCDQGEGSWDESVISQTSRSSM
jgi:predicted O-methyltransferase YrrM